MKPEKQTKIERIRDLERKLVGAGQQCMELYFDIARRMEAGAELAASIAGAAKTAGNQFQTQC